MSELVLLVGGRRYSGWMSVRVTRSIETLAGSFDLEVSDRWAAQDVPWPIAEEDACRVEIDTIPVIDGTVDRRSMSMTGTSLSLSYTGRDRAAALIDNSAILDHYTFRGANVLDIARKVAEPFGVEVNVQAGVALPMPTTRVVVNPGESPYEVMHRAAVASGVLLVSDGQGGVLITRAGVRRAAVPLVQGRNVLSASVEYNAAERFHRYVIASQVSGAEWLKGVDKAEETTRIHAEAIDLGVKRRDRVRLIRPETGMTGDVARRRADWEARVRAAKAEEVTISVQGWREPGGARLWPLNAIYGVHVPRIGINGDMLSSHIEHTLGAQGETTQIRLVRPDAFTPEPKAQVKATAGGWKELAGGAGSDPKKGAK